MAKGENINLVLYGHTHISNTEYDEGIYFVNPGSLSSPREGSRSYAVVDILPKGIMPIIIKA
jgi:putative phosphoesterase